MPLRFLGATIGALMLIASPAGAQAPPDVAYPATSYVASHGRGLDQAMHPDYQARMLPGYRAGATSAPGWERLFGVDPYLAQEGPKRADWLEVTFENRYGAKLAGTLIAPKAGGPHPAIVIEPGGSGPRWGYLNLAQGLAESGYVTLVIAAQGDLDADTRPADPDPSTPQNEYCEPGEWQNGEGGVREMGACAGEAPAAQGPTVQDVVVATATGPDELRGLDEIYRAVRARKAFGVLDATRYLVSDDNPWRDRVDGDRIGAAGHSFGAHGATVAGQIDSRELIKAVVAWDGFGPLDGIQPRVPTMFQNSEPRLIGPRTAPSARDAHPGARIQQAFAGAGVPSAVLTLADSTHQEWNYIPYLGVTVGSLVLAGDPTGAEAYPSSSLGERVALHYTLAWFDRWLKPGLEESARERLFARKFDDSADRVAIGQGTFDPVTRTNLPYKIARRAVRRHLSPWFVSRADFDGVDCADLRSGC
jgi:dienelactone hydrolase